MAIYELAQTQTRQGHLHQADQSYQRGLDLGTAQGGHLAAIGSTYVGRGDLQHEWNHLEEAAFSLHEGIAQCEQTGNTPNSSGRREDVKTPSSLVWDYGTITSVLEAVPLVLLEQEGCFN